jgi:UDP-GlcNAc3NAcA epimerase
MKILTVLGARPQFIKASVVSRAIRHHNQQTSSQVIEEVIVHTGQHYDHNMSDVFFAELQIPNPQFNLGVGGISHGAMTGKMLEKIEEILLKEKPDAVLVYGDTNSTLAGALAAVKLHIRVAHVEAGLRMRSFDMTIPEEVNRLLTDQISHWLFCPTETALKNLKQEGFFDREQVLVSHVGDVMYDAALFYQKIAKPTNTIASLIEELDSQFYLATVHREENTNNPNRLSNIMEALDTISQITPVVLPLHPRTRKLLRELHLPQKIQILEPVSYFDMITLLSHCQGVFTDSGGLQKEAYFFHKPCVTILHETEWVELVQHGFNTLATADKERILQAEKDLKNSNKDYSLSLYGTGDAGDKIIQNLLRSK